jgi:CelD/BcsL family acetyltransferase involved in cellulose biosynthesis
MNAPGAFVAAREGAPFATADALVAGCQVATMTPAELLADAALLAEWDALADHAAEPNPFAERWYLTAALNAFETGSVSVAVVRDHGLIGIMPLTRQSHYAGLPIRHVQNWQNHNAFLGTPLIRKGAELSFWHALLAQFDNANDGALFLHLTGLPTGGPVVSGLKAACAKDKRRHALVQHEGRALLEHGLSPEAYLEANVRGKKRKELRRQNKRLAEEGALTFDRSDGGEELAEWIEEFIALEARGWKGGNGSAIQCAPETRQLFAGAINGAASTGKLELLTYRLDGRAIAMLANFLTPPGAFSFKTAFDEDYARFSPGVLLQIENLALLERDGIEWCDSCAAQDHPMIDSLWCGRREIGRYSVAIGGVAKRASFAALLAAEQTKAKFRGRAK